MNENDLDETSYIEDDDITPEIRDEAEDESEVSEISTEKDEEQHTESFYKLFQAAFEHYNEYLFNGNLPNVIITVTRKRNIGGYFSPSRWASDKGKRVHEISMNPTMFAKSSFLQIMSIFVHEMCHLHREIAYDKPSRGGYHDKRWVNKMIELGLPPVSQDSPNGTGQRVSHRILKDGLFIKASLKFSETRIHYADRFETMSSNISIVDELEALNEEKSIDEQIKENNKQDVLQNEKPEEDISDQEDLAKTPEGEIPVDERTEEKNPAKKVKEEDKKLDEITRSNEEVISDIESTAVRKERKPKTKSKYKYQCECKTNIWGKINLVVLCPQCETIFVNQEI